MRSYDVIVVGLGGMGSAALYHLARRGVSALGIEQFGAAHDRGSSHGRTRIIRKAYFEHPDYVPLLHRAYDLWSDLETETGRELFVRAGLLLAGPPEGAVIAGVRKAADQHRLAIENVDAQRLAADFPGFRWDNPADDMACLFEPDAGFLWVEECVHTHIAQAKAHGAAVLLDQAVKSWSAGGGGVRVETDGGRYSAAKLVLCAGAWTGRVLAELGLPLEVRRKVALWFRPLSDVYELRRGCPAFGFDTADGFYYGFPAVDDSGVKAAKHTGGQAIDDPDALDREYSPADAVDVQGFIARHIPLLEPTVRQHSVCMYTMTPDEHFVVDIHREYPHVAYAAGFSGHGFKFAPVIGSVLTDLVMQGRTAEPIGFLRASRLGIGKSEV